jgi:hypothetical protein
MAHKQEPNVTTTFDRCVKKTSAAPGPQRLPCCPPAIPAEMQLKWGLAMLGEDKAFEYLKWLQRRIEERSK